MSARKSRPRSLRTLGEFISTAKVNARRRGLKWRLTDRQAAALMTAPCVYCGSLPAPFSGLDRQGNEPFYSIKNVVSCCWRCNRAKSNDDARNLIYHAEQIVGHNFDPADVAWEPEPVIVEDFDWMQI